MDSIPNNPTDVLLLPGIALLFGLLVYVGGIVNGLSAHSPAPKYRWVGVVLLGVSTVIGILTVNRLFGSTGEFYRAMIGDRKVLLAHYVSLGLPLVFLAAVPLAEAWFKRSQQDMR